MAKRRRKKKSNAPILVLIGILGVLLVVAIVVAATMPGAKPPVPTNPPQGTTPGTDTTEATEPQPTMPKELILSVDPAGDVKASSGEILRLEVTAYDGAKVTAKVGDRTVNFHRDRDASQSGYAVYTGAYAFVGDLPADMGQIDYDVEVNGVAVSKHSGNVTYEKNTNGGYVVEVIDFNAETFDGFTGDDYSHPTNNYLPGGTMDYCQQDLVSTSSQKYVLWRFGRRTYVEKRNYPANKKTQVTTRYDGTLPDHNELGFASMEVVGHHTVLTLDSLWKAPFTLDILPQAYKNANGGSNRSYLITSFTPTYVEIKFSYATSFAGEIQLPEEESMLFSSAEVIQGENDCTLKLYLKKTGGFYGWDAWYNEDGQLCLSFLNPVSATKAVNSYGADLSGITVYIDVGHGGLDGGAVGKDENGKQWTEADRNLALSNALKKELESIGATVIMNREDNSSINVDDRNWGVHEVAPDLCIAVHHNAADGYPKSNGFDVYYYHPFGAAPTQAILKWTAQAGVYQKTNQNWYNYFVARESVCPIVLTENGFLTNAADIANTIDPTAVAQKARAMTQGIAEYFLSVQ